MPDLKSVLRGKDEMSAPPANEIRRLIENGAFLLDVRNLSDARRGMAPGATNIPLPRLKRQLAALPNYRIIITYCGTGERAARARDILEATGRHAVNGGTYAGILEILRREQSAGH